LIGRVSFPPLAIAFRRDCECIYSGLQIADLYFPALGNA
jgi:hypothetical protein